MMESFVLSVDIFIRKSNYSYPIHQNGFTRDIFKFNSVDKKDCVLKQNFYEIYNNVTIISINKTNEYDKLFPYESTGDNNLSMINKVFTYRSKNGIADVFSKILSKDDNSIVFQFTHICDINMRNQLNLHWDVLTLIYFYNEIYISFDILKFCDSPVNTGSIISGLLIFCLGFLFVLLSTNIKYQVTNSENQREGEIHAWHVIGFVIMGSALLILLFYFKNLISTIFTILVILQAFTSLYLTLKSFLESYELHNKFAIFQMVIFGNEVYVYLCCLVCGFIVLTWFVTKHWILNDLIGFCFVFTILSLLHLNSFKISVFLLFCTFLYDVFWVFYSPKIFSDNLMVSAATQLNLPIKLEIPIFDNRNPLKNCVFLGIGDLVIPGFLIKFCRKFDFLKGTNRYYNASMILYAMSLLSSGFVMIFFNHAQPVLLYVFPIMFTGIISLAWIRNEVMDIWLGVHRANNNRNRATNNHNEIADAMELDNVAV